VWLVKFEHNLYPTLKKFEGNIRKMLMNIIKTKQISRLEIKFSFNNKTSRQFDR
jgi:hypothetical protein